jgi:hypothetical protein
MIDLNKKPLPGSAGAKAELISVSTAFSGLIAFLAINGLVGRRPKRHFGLLAALGAYGRVHLPWIASVSVTSAIPLAILPCSSAAGAPLWFVLKAFFLIKGLFAFCEEKFCSAVSASK